MKRVNLFFLLAMLAVSTWSFVSNHHAPAPADPAAKALYIEPDSTFIIEAASSGKLEVELATLAQQKASSQRVKDYAAMVATDHTNANQELASLAAQKNYALADALLDKHQKFVDQLASLSGADFDRAYIDAVIEIHKDDIDEFEDASTKAQDADVRAWAAKTLPILQGHHETATSIRQEL